jgi:hypothetical protein
MEYSRTPFERRLEFGGTGRGYLIAEAGSSPGTFFATFPRHRQMISINKPHTGHDDPELTLRWDWNSLLSDDPNLRFTRYTGLYYPQADDYSRYLDDFATARSAGMPRTGTLPTLANRWPWKTLPRFES